MTISLDEMQIYIANLGKYNEGQLVGDLFSFPVDEEASAERIGLNAAYEEYAIHDFQVPFPINEYDSIDRLNRIYESLQEIKGTPIYDELDEILNYWFNDIEELLEHADDIICYSECESMRDVAEYYVEETGVLNSLPGNLRYYFDYSALGRDLEIEGNYLITSSGVFEYQG